MNSRGITSHNDEAIIHRDALWLERIAYQNDAKALAEIFEYYGPQLKGWLVSRGAGASTAEDILQDVMIKVWTKAHLFDPNKASFATWVYRMTRNSWIDHLRKHARVDIREPRVMRQVADKAIPSSEGDFIDQQDIELLREHIDQLKVPQKMVLKMAFTENKTYKEIAEEMGLPLGTVKTRIRTALQALKVDMAKYGNNKA